MNDEHKKLIHEAVLPVLHERMEAIRATHDPRVFDVALSLQAITSTCATLCGIVFENDDAGNEDPREAHLREIVFAALRRMVGHTDCDVDEVVACFTLVAAAMDDASTAASNDGTSVNELLTNIARALP